MVNQIDRLRAGCLQSDLPGGVLVAQRLEGGQSYLRQPAHFFPAEEGQLFGVAIEEEREVECVPYQDEGDGDNQATGAGLQEAGRARQATGVVG